jgi:hypothetical protein
MSNHDVFSKVGENRGISPLEIYKSHESKGYSTKSFNRDSTTKNKEMLLKQTMPMKRDSE